VTKEKRRFRTPNGGTDAANTRVARKLSSPADFVKDTAVNRNPARLKIAKNKLRADVWVRNVKANLELGLCMSHCSQLHSPNTIVLPPGMCFRHWKATTTSNSPHELALSHLAEPAEEHYNSARANLPSVYDNVIPSSITWKIDRASSPMSLVSFLTSNFKLGRGWHRNQEWAARGDLMVGSLSMHLQAWEKQLVMLETALLAGIRNAPYRELAHAWGKHLGFHSDLVTTICKRKGDLDRLRSPRRNCN